MNNRFENNFVLLKTKLSLVSSHKQALIAIKEMIAEPAEKRLKGYATFNNVHTLITAFYDPAYQKVLNDSTVAFTDGAPLAFLARHRGNKEAKRIFGPRFFDYALRATQNTPFSHYFFGTSDENLKKLILCVKKRYPKLKIAGYHSPPYQRTFNSIDRQHIELIKESQADFIWVALGAPKQEIWMSENANHLNHGALLGVGAAFEYFIGNHKRAPIWMQKYFLEWLYRFFQEPKRLFWRYLSTNLPFVCLILKEEILRLLYSFKFKK